MARILVIDDDPKLTSLIARYLERCGHAVEQASDGTFGLRALASRPVDLVITDIVMPNQEGLATIRALRKDHPGLPIVAMSGGGSLDGSDYLRAARLMGAVATLSKPFRLEELTAIVDRVLADDADHA